MVSQIQGCLILCCFFFRNFALTWLANLHRFSNLCDNFWFDEILHRLSLVILIFCRRLAGSDVTVMPSVICMDWLCWWYISWLVYLPPLVLAFLTNMSKTCKSTSSSAIQEKYMKDNQYWREIRCNNLTSKRWTNCWHMP